MKFPKVCSEVTLYGFATDALAYGDMKAHRYSLAENTLLKIIASRIEKVSAVDGNFTLVYHIDGLQKYFRRTGVRFHKWLVTKIYGMRRPYDVIKFLFRAINLRRPN